MRRNTIFLIALFAGLAFFQMGGCYYYDDDDDDDIRVTVINNHFDDIAIEVDNHFWGWTFVAWLEPGETEILHFNDHYDGEDIRARDDGSTIKKGTIFDGLVFNVGGSS